MNTVHNVLSFA